MVALFLEKKIVVRLHNSEKVANFLGLIPKKLLIFWNFIIFVAK